MSATSITRLYCTRCRSWQDIEVIEVMLVHVISLLKIREVASRQGWSTESRNGETVDVCETCTEFKKAGIEPEYERSGI